MVVCAKFKAKKNRKKKMACCHSDGSKAACGRSDSAAVATLCNIAVADREALSFGRRAFRADEKTAWCGRLQTEITVASELRLNSHQTSIRPMTYGKAINSLLNPRLG